MSDDVRQDPPRPPSPRTRVVLAALATTAVVLAVDQITKAIAERTIHPGMRVPVLESAVHLVHARNSGIAGGRLADAGTTTIAALSLTALVALVAFAWWLGPRRWLWLPVGLILGGGLGNLLDRLRDGHVTDFIVVGPLAPANMADWAITLGVVGVVLVAWRPGPAPPAGAGT